MAGDKGIDRIDQGPSPIRISFGEIAREAVGETSSSRGSHENSRSSQRGAIVVRDLSTLEGSKELRNGRF